MGLMEKWKITGFVHTKGRRVKHGITTWM